MNLWIARDKDGLFAFPKRPEKRENGYFFGEIHYYLDDKLFEEVTFENSPKQIEIKFID